MLRDPPIESAEAQKKAQIKKAIREGIKNNSLLSQVLKDNQAEGKFIKEVTKNYMDSRNDISTLVRTIELRMISYEPINVCMYWSDTSQGYKYWHTLNNIYRELKRKQLSK